MGTPANLIKCVGLVTHGSELALPEGSLKDALNVNVDEDGVITPRRGFDYYKTPTGGDEDIFRVVKQLLEYKNTLIRHYQNRLDFENANGDFIEFEGDYFEVQIGTRIKFKESNSNLYFTTNSGIKKIEATSKSNLTKDSIKEAGGVKAGYVEAKAIPSPGGFLPPQSKVAYRIIYGTKDLNGTLIEGTPSSRVVVTNYSQDTYNRERSSITISEGGLEDATNYDANIAYNKGQEVYDVDSGYYYKAKIDVTTPIDVEKKVTGEPSSTKYWEYFGIVRDGDHFVYENSKGKYCIYYDMTGEASSPSTSATVGSTFIKVATTGALTSSEIINATANVISEKIEDTEVQVDIANPKKLNFASIEDGDIVGLGGGRDRNGSSINTRLKAETEVEGSVNEGSFSSVEISTIIPEKVTEDYFLQLYRTAVIEATDAIPVLELDPGDECSLVYEKSITEEDLALPEKLLIIEDNASESFRASNQSLYTNEVTGEGILQANEIPPVALDVELFRNSMFYGNTRTRHTLNFDVISVNDFVSEKTRLVVSGVNGSRYYTFRGESQKLQLTVDSVPSAKDYIEFRSASNERYYYIYFGTLEDDPEREGAVSYKISINDFDTSNPYESTSSYEVGDIVYYENRRYRCAKDIAIIDDITPSGANYSTPYWEYLESHVNNINNEIRTILSNIIDYEVKAGVEYNNDPQNYIPGDVTFIEDKYYQRRLIYSVEYENTTYPAGALVVHPRPNIDDNDASNSTYGYLYRKRELTEGTPDIVVSPPDAPNDFTTQQDLYWEFVDVASAVEYDSTPPTSYVEKDLVSINGYVYKCNVAVASIAPSGNGTSNGQWLVYNPNPTDNANSSIIWDEINEFSLLIDNNVLTIDYIENGITEGFNTTSGSFTINNLSIGIGDEVVPDRGGFVLLSKSPSIAQSIDVTSKSIIKAIAKDLDSEVDPFYLSTSEDLPGKILLESKSILDNKVYIAIESGYDQHIANNPYVVGDKVKYLGEDYICIKDNSDPDPTNVLNWEKIKLGEEFNANLSNAKSIESFVGGSELVTITIQDHLLEDDNIVYISVDLSESYTNGGTYNTGDRVSINGVNYECIQAHTAKEPVALYDSTISYEIGDLVLFEDKIYECIADIFNDEPVVGNPPSGNLTDNDYWQYIEEAYWGYRGLPFSGLYTVKNSTQNTFDIEESSLENITYNPQFSTVYIPIIESDDAKFQNRLYYSKPYQPEAVPSLNYVDVGPKDSPILRILSLRDNLFVLKDDGIYIVSGTSAPNFTVRLLDNTRILAPDSAVVLNNQIYCLTEQGVATVTDSGVGVISRKIENLIDFVTSTVTDYKTKSFGIAYENDRSYLLFVPQEDDDIASSLVFRYNIFERTWTKWSYNATCGLVASFDDKIYLGDSDSNYISQERKTGKRSDFAGRQLSNNILAGGVLNNVIRLGSTVDLEVGDVVMQTQDVTINYFNRRLLRKIDLFEDGLWQDFSISLTDPVEMTTSYEHFIFDNDEFVFRVSYIPLENSYDSSLVYNIGEKVSFNRNNYICVATTSGLNDPLEDPSGDESATLFWEYINDDVINIKESFKTSKINDYKFSIDFDNINNKIVSIELTDFYEKRFSAKAGDNLIDRVQLLAIFLESRDPSLSIGIITNENLLEKVNELVDLLNNENSITSKKDYLKPTTVTFETYINILDKLRNQATLKHSRPFLEGNIIVFKNIKKVIEWNPQHFGDPSSIKQVRHASIIFDQNNFYAARAKFYSDAAQSKKTVPFEGKGIAYWSDQGYDSGNDYWGGVGNDIPFRNPVPSGKQKCRYLSMIFEHDNAREYFRILGISAIVRKISDRGWR